MTYVQLRSWGVPKGPYVISRVHMVSNRPHGVCPGREHKIWPFLPSLSHLPDTEGALPVRLPQEPNNSKPIGIHWNWLVLWNVRTFSIDQEGREKHFLPLKANARKQYAPLFLLQIYILDYYHLSDPDKWNESLTHQNSTWNNQIWQKD